MCSQRVHTRNVQCVCVSMCGLCVECVSVGGVCMDAVVCMCTCARDCAPRPPRIRVKVPWGGPRLMAACI